MFYDQMKRIKKGKTILKVFGVGDQEDPVHIANVVLESQLYTSAAGDTRLQFRHERVHRDYKYYIGKDLTGIIEDPVFEQPSFKSGTHWIFDTPESAWPQDNDEEAKEMYTE